MLRVRTTHNRDTPNTLDAGLEPPSVMAMAMGSLTVATRYEYRSRKRY